MINKLLLLVFVVSVSTVSGFSQRYLTGKVVKILEGNSVEVFLGGNRKTEVLIQFIAIPHKDQVMHEIVEAHLAELILNKNVRVKVTSLNSLSEYGIQKGVVYSGNQDIGLQMLRDGAAWYNLPEKDNQNAGERRIYLENEAAAQKEKLGIWAVQDLVSPWEYQKQIRQRYKKLIPAAMPEERILESPSVEKNRFVWFPEIRVNDDFEMEGRFLLGFERVVLSFNFFTKESQSLYSEKTVLKLTGDDTEYTLSALTYRKNFDAVNLNRYKGEKISGTIPFYQFLEMINKKKIFLTIDGKKIELGEKSVNALRGLASKIKLE